ncbi:hypothetical protein Hanom_Chr15g01399221 [Helianthus anomalus]
MIEQERRDVAEAAKAAKDKGKGNAAEDVVGSSSDKVDDTVPDISLFNLVGTPVIVSYSKEETARRIVVEHRRMKSKKDDKKDDEEDHEEEVSDDLFTEINDYHYNGNDGDNDDDG